MMDKKLPSVLKATFTVYFSFPTGKTCNPPQKNRFRPHLVHKWLQWNASSSRSKWCAAPRPHPLQLAVHAVGVREAHGSWRTNRTWMATRFLRDLKRRIKAACLDVSLPGTWTLAGSDGEGGAQDTTGCWERTPAPGGGGASPINHLARTPICSAARSAQVPCSELRGGQQQFLPRKDIFVLRVP